MQFTPNTYETAVISRGARGTHAVPVVEKLPERTCTAFPALLNSASEMTYIVSSGALNSTRSLTPTVKVFKNACTHISSIHEF